jgi:hypothetical protein
MRTIKPLVMALLMFAGVTAMAQDKYDYGTDSAECVKNLSLFNEYAKQAAYTDAYPFWSNREFRPARLCAWDERK